MSARTGLRAICAVMISSTALCGAGFVAGPALAQGAPANAACLALSTDAERLVCMRDARAAADAAAAGAAAPAPAGGGSASAQAMLAQSGAAERCMALATDAEKLACMQGALAMAEAALASGGGGAVADDDDGFLGLGIFGGGGDRPDPLLASQDEFQSGFGAEQLSGYRDPDAGREQYSSLSASIVAHGEFAPGQMQFELDNGQVWRQLGGDTQKFPFLDDDPIPVVLSESWAGGYRMTLLEEDRVVRVQRIQ